LGLLESADLLGRYRYVELSAFELLGRRAARAVSPAVAIYLSGASLAHGWRARLVEERLPVAAGLPPVRDSTRPPSPELLDAFALLARADDADLLDAIVGALYPAMAAGYAGHVAIASPVADPPVLRMLGRLMSDLDAVRSEGAALVAGAARPTSGSRRAIEGLLARAGGPFGPLRPLAGGPRAS
jgi:hypothetical protein